MFRNLVYCYVKQVTPSKNWDPLRPLPFWKYVWRLKPLPFPFSSLLLLFHSFYVFKNITIVSQSSDKDNGSWLTRSFTGVNLIFHKALNAAWVYQCNFTPTLLETSLLFANFASRFILWSGIIFFFHWEKKNHHTFSI